jgi:xanthine dehydrogenase small subunit
MLTFILNDTEISTDNASGGTVLDFIRYHQHLKGTKIGCREGDCGACTILVGSLSDSAVTYRAMTSCLMPLANAQGKHLVTVEGINRPDGNLTAVQHALVEENGTQCGFCTVGFVMSLTGFCLNHSARPLANVAPNEAAIAAIDGNICRCTGYKSIERAAASLSRLMQQNQEQNVLDFAIQQHIIPSYFGSIATKLAAIAANAGKDALRKDHNQTDIFVGGGTDLYVQRHEEMPHLPAKNLFDHANLQGISEKNDQIEIMESPLMHAIFPRLREHLKLVSSTPIRNMATLAGNVANASPIGDLTIWLLALNARLQLSDGTARREIALRDFYLGYKNMAKSQTEVIEKITFTRPRHTNHFNFEKVCKRTYLDIASVNTAILLEIEKGYIATAHVSAGGVSPIPLYLKNTAAFLKGKMTEKRAEWLPEAHAILQSEVSPISDVRGSAEYKRLLLRQLFQAHFAL